MKVIAHVFNLDAKTHQYVETGTRELDLEPCPFCGAEPEAMILGNTTAITCNACDISMDYPRPVDKAIEQWNRRA